MEKRSFGVVYAAIGRPYLTMALASAASLRVSNPSVPYTIITDVDVDPTTIPWFSSEDRLVPSDHTPSENRLAKISVSRSSPYERSLFLDADTLVLGSLDFIPFALEHFDVLARISDAPRDHPRTSHRILGSSWPMHRATICNGGVIAFRNGQAAEAFFTRWDTGFRELGLAIDQPSLLDALYDSPARFFPLPSRFNAFAQSREIAVLHYTRRADRTVRKLVEHVGRAVLHDHEQHQKALRAAMQPKNPRKRRRLDYRRDRNRDRLRTSPAEAAAREIRDRGWLGGAR